MSDLARTVRVDLEYAEVVVLSHLLDRIQNGKGFASIVDDTAEIAALDSLAAVLEPKIDDIFGAAYASTLHASKKRLTGTD